MYRLDKMHSVIDRQTDTGQTTSHYHARKKAIAKMTTRCALYVGYGCPENFRESM